MTFTQEQVDKLLAPIKPRRVLQAQGQSHVPAFDVIAHLTRIFGWGGWHKEILSLDLVREHSEMGPGGRNKPDRPGWWVTYRCVMRLTVRDPEGHVQIVTEDAATGSAQNMPFFGDAHDFAVKNAVSYALKRCAKDLGDQFGLSLYNKGQTDALLGRTLVQPNVPADAADDVEEHAPEPLTLGNDEREEPVEVSGEGQGTAASGPPPVPVSSSTWERVAAKIANLDESTGSALKDWSHAQGWKVTRRALSEEQAQQVLAWEPDK